MRRDKEWRRWGKERKREREKKWREEEERGGKGGKEKESIFFPHSDCNIILFYPEKLSA